MGGNLDCQAQRRAVLLLIRPDLSYLEPLAAPLEPKPYGRWKSRTSLRFSPVDGGMTSGYRAAPEQPDLHNRDQGTSIVPRPTVRSLP